jgi:hypothetical protein
MQAIASQSVLVIWATYTVSPARTRDCCTACRQDFRFMAASWQRQCSVMHGQGPATAPHTPRHQAPGMLWQQLTRRHSHCQQLVHTAQLSQAAVQYNLHVQIMHAAAAAARARPGQAAAATLDCGQAVHIGTQTPPACHLPSAAAAGGGNGSSATRRVILHSMAWLQLVRWPAASASKALRQSWGHHPPGRSSAAYHPQGR